MAKTSPSLIEKSRNLRKRGFTLGEIVKKIGLPKTTVYDHIRDIPLPVEVKERIKRENIQRLKKIRHVQRRKVFKPKIWSDELIFLVSHFMFDGEIRDNNGCVYQNRNMVLINQVRNLMKEIFRLKPINRFYPETGVHRISYFYVNLANYIKKKSQKLKRYIKNTSLSEKKIFLRAFYDDEGCVYFWRNSRKVRGYQHDLEILKLVQEILKDFAVDSQIDEKYKEIVISRKENLIKFRNKINFSKGVFINPNRKNSIWKQKLEKREILNRAINSYKK